MRDAGVAEPPEESARTPLARFEAVTKRFGGFTAIRDLSLDIFAGEFLALLGPSGCGKTTLLRLLAGFESPDAGRVLMQGRNLDGVPPYRRPLNTMFQSYALFPHLTVAANVRFGLRYDGLTKSEADQRVREMLALVKLESMDNRRPHQLSGGQRQRVALARALAKRPKLLLLDEPMAALDRKLRESTQLELVDLRRKLGTTFVIVTHDQDEAMTMADRIAVMEQGRLAQVGSPREIYEHPQSRYVADFLGDVNLVEGRLVTRADGRAVVDAGGQLRLHTTRDAGVPAGTTVWFAVRPGKIRIAPHAAEPAAENRFRGSIAELSYRGEVSNYLVQLDAGPMMKVMSTNSGTRDGAWIRLRDRVWLCFDSDAGSVLTR